MVELSVLVNTLGWFYDLFPYLELSLVEVPEPLPPKLLGPTIMAAGVLSAAIKRYAGT